MLGILSTMATARITITIKTVSRLVRSTKALARLVNMSPGRPGSPRCQHRPPTTYCSEMGSTPRLTAHSISCRGRNRDP